MVRESVFFTIKHTIRIPPTTLAPASLLELD